MKPLNLHEGIESTLLILNGRLKAKGNKLGIRTIKEYGELPEVECNGGQINQVFMNIITNGIDALESASKNPEFLNSQPDSASFVPTIRIRTAMKGKGHVEIRISDNGPGIPTEYRSRLFDPFFTTKAVGKGTGLGLAISYQIVVDKHGGRLDYQSQPGKGTEFAIVLPLRQKRKRNGET
jgi:signal transduction histidine kinase